MDNKFTVYNTHIQGQPLVAATNGYDIRALEFSAALKELPPITASTGVPGITSARLNVNHLVQASVGHLLVDASASAGNLYLGPDTADNAKNYMSLFDIKDMTGTRVLDFVLHHPDQAVYLKTNQMTNDYIKVNTASSSNPASDMLFNVAGTSATGTHHFVLLSKESPTGVNFAILPGCCGDIPPQLVIV